MAAEKSNVGNEEKSNSKKYIGSVSDASASDQKITCSRIASHTEEPPHATGGMFLSGGTRMLIMLVMTFGFFLIEMTFGYISYSMALVADSFHMLSDVMALSIAFACLKIAERTSKNNTFGWVRAEVLGALINGVFLLALCFSIFVESLTRIVEPHPIKEPIKVLIVGVIGLLINLIGMFMFHGHSHSHAHGHAHSKNNGTSADVDVDLPRATIDGIESQHLMSSHQEGAMALAQLDQDVRINLEAISYFNRDDSDKERLKITSKRGRKSRSKQLNMQGVFLHVLGDAVGSVIVIISALVSWRLTGYESLKLYLDPILSLALVLLMTASTLPLVRETALILMQTTPGFIEIQELEESLLKIDGVRAVHEFHVWRLVGERIIATVHIKFSDLKAYINAADEIRTLFHDNSIHSTTIQPEFSEMSNSLGVSEKVCALACPPQNCKRTDVTCCKRLNTHLSSSQDKELLPSLTLLEHREPNRVGENCLGRDSMIH